MIYIMGTGRSGSTVLHVLLSNAPDALGVGELTHLWRDLAADTQCSCGVSVQDCQVWSEAAKAVRERGDELADRSRLRRRFESHSSLWEQLLGLVSAETWAEYRRYTRDMLDAPTSDVSVLVDSSKYASRANALSEVLGDRIKIVWLTREPAGLLASFSKRRKGEQPGKSRLQLLAYYGYVMLSARIVATFRRKQVIMIRYEDLVRDPTHTLRSIGAWAGLDLDPVIGQVEAGKPIEVGHILTGNRLRTSQSIRFNRGEAERVTRPSPVDRLTLALMRVWRRVLAA